MNDDISKPISQGSDGTQDAEIAVSQQSPMNSNDFAQYMKRNLEIANKM